MKHLRLQSLFLLLILQQLAWAGPRTFKQAQAIAERQAAQMGVTISEQAKARSFGSSPSVSADAQTSVGTAAYYVFPYGEDKGYAIVSGDDQMPELVAYSDKGTFDEAHMADGCRSFLQAYKAVADAVAKGDEKALRLMAQKRGLLASAGYKQPAVEPLLGNIEWNQGNPYKMMCPYNEKWEMRSLAGCVATAMAQVMRYWKYPSELKADIPAYTSHLEGVDESDVYEIPQINKGETYDWDNMLPQYDSDGYSDEQAAAVAKLMFHCGAAAQMQYSVDMSGTWLTSDVLSKYFGYDPDLLCDVFRSEFSLDGWCRLIDGELTAKRPIIYAGFSSAGGHLFVCDGADGNGLYHINWGWSGTNNGYYDISLLDSERGQSGKGKDGFTQTNSMIIGIQPDNGVKDEPIVETQALAVYPNGRELTVTKGERASVSEPFELYCSTSFINLRPKEFNGFVNLGIKDDKGNYVPLLPDHYFAPIAGASSEELPEILLQCRIRYAFPVGTTKLYEIYSTDNEKTWQPCSNFEESYPFEVVATETSLSVVPEKDDFKATLQAEGYLGRKQKCNFSYTMHNENAHDYFGAVQVYVSHTADEVPTDLAVQDYVSIEAGGSTTHYFTLHPEDEGDLYIWLYDAKHNKMMVEAQKFTVNAAPKLKMLSQSINWKENTFERENAYYSYDGKRAALPVIDGDEAILKYVIQNDGGDFNGGIGLYVTAFSAGDWTPGVLELQKECNLKGNGGVAELKYRFHVSELKGFRSFDCALFTDNFDDIDCSLIPEYSICYIDEDKMETISGRTLLGYFADNSTAISSTPAVIGGLQVSAGKGSLTITSAASQPVAIYSLAGQCVRRLQVQAGAATTVLLPSGIYVLGKQKVMVR